MNQPNNIDLDINDEANRPGIRLCNLALREALTHGASQVRLEPQDSEGGSVEFLVGSDWRPVMKVPVEAHRFMIAHLKSIAGLSPTERQGNLHIVFAGRQHAAVLAVPTLDGTDSVLLTLGPAT